METREYIGIIQYPQYLCCQAASNNEYCTEPYSLEAT